MTVTDKDVNNAPDERAVEVPMLRKLRALRRGQEQEEE